MKWLLAMLIVMLASPVWSAGPDEATRAEIAHLLHYLQSSGCQFQRNGSWYASARAASHLNEKYQYLLKKDLITNTESFIERAASESSVSSKPYSVKCGSTAAVPSAVWLRDELQRLRAKKAE
jgi:Family of unknown function (DUF5329)